MCYPTASPLASAAESKAQMSPGPCPFPRVRRDHDFLLPGLPALIPAPATSSPLSIPTPIFPSSNTTAASWRHARCRWKLSPAPAPLLLLLSPPVYPLLLQPPGTWVGHVSGMPMGQRGSAVGHLLATAWRSRVSPHPSFLAVENCRSHMGRQRRNHEIEAGCITESPCGGQVPGHPTCILCEQEGNLLY